MSKMIIGVHDGVFHADDTFSIAMLRILYPDLLVLRSRDPEVLKRANIRVDVGDKFNPPTDFDHHQQSSPVRDNGIPYSSAGLVADYFKFGLFGTQKVFEVVDRSLMLAIDAQDNGIQTSRPIAPFKPYSISSVISLKIPRFSQTGLSTDQIDAILYSSFLEAVDLASQILKGEIAYAENYARDVHIVQGAIDASWYRDPRLIIINHPVPWRHFVINHAPEALFVITPDERYSCWILHTIPIVSDGVQSGNRHDLPAAWAGKRDQELVDCTGVADAIFCHKDLFQARAKGKGGILALAEQALP